MARWPRGPQHFSSTLRAAVPGWDTKASQCSTLPASSYSTCSALHIATMTSVLCSHCQSVIRRPRACTLESCRQRCAQQRFARQIQSCTPHACGLGWVWSGSCKATARLPRITAAKLHSCSAQRMCLRETSLHKRRATSSLWEARMQCTQRSCAASAANCRHAHAAAALSRFCQELGAEHEHDAAKHAVQQFAELVMTWRAARTKAC